MNTPRATGHDVPLTPADPSDTAAHELTASHGAAPPASTHQAVMGAEDGSIVTEYGLVAVVGATIAAVAINWASSGGVYDLFAAVLEKVKVIIGA